MRTRLLTVAASKSASWLVVVLSAAKVAAVLIGSSLLVVPGRFPDN
jgi:hypothetical protein